MHPRNSKAFTLIELLIVVAIIAILAAIAVPNFLEAQVRSKVSRVKADIRTLATAIESYAVDHNKPPREFSSTRYGDTPVGSGVIFPGKVNGDHIQAGVSTPIAYITSAFIFDPFVNRDASINFDEQTFTYQNMGDRLLLTPTAFWVEAIDFYGAWRMCSIGPDRSFFHPGVGTPSAQLVYDPTNGTVSQGNIWRSQKEPDASQPPVGNLIGAS